MTPAAPKPPKKPKRDPRAEWREEKAEWLAANPTCQVRFYPDSGPCGGPVQVHHVEARSAGGSRRKDLKKITACMAHHQKIERERMWAKQHGLLISVVSSRRNGEGNEDTLS